MRAEYVTDRLRDLIETVKRLHDPNILSISIGNYSLDGIHLRITGDPTPVICDIGLGLFDRDDEWDDEWIRCSMNDINGVTVYWLEKKETPDAATSGESRERIEVETADTVSLTRIGAEVKEDNHDEG